MINSTSTTRHAPGAALLAVLMLLSFTARAAAPQPEIPSEWPRWLQKAMKKESRTKRQIDLDLGDGRILAPLLGKLQADVETNEQFAFVASDIGGDSPVQCWFYFDGVDMANSIQQIQFSLIESVAELNEKPVKDRLPYYLDSGAYDGVPYLALEYIFTVGDDESHLIGLSKARIAQIGDATVACAHNEPGYRKTFARLFEKLVSKAVVKPGSNVPYYREIYQFSLGDQPIGVALTELSEDAEGDTSIRTGTATIVQVGPQTLSVTDSAAVEFSTPDGRLINAVDVSVTDSRMDTNITLVYAESGNWLASGLFQGKEVTYEIDGSADPVSSLGLFQSVAEMLADGDRKKVEFPAWIAEADPSSFQQAGFELQERKKKLYSGVLTAGFAMDVRMDAQGSVVDGRFQMGPNTMILTRLWKEGQIPSRGDDRD